MLDGCARYHFQDTVRSLKSLPRDDALLRLGVDPANVELAKNAVAGVGTPLTPDEIIARAFRKPYRVGRFGDGSAPVFYSALEDETCVSEMRYHLKRELDDMASGEFPHSRYYSMVSCWYSGPTADLRGQEAEHPELVGSTTEGYPFCQELGSRAVGMRLSGFITPSARRRPTGQCVPVFAEAALSEPKIAYRGKFDISEGQVEFERIDDGAGPLKS